MRYNDLVKQIAVSSDLPQAKIKQVLNLLIDTVTEELAEGRSVRLPSLGTVGVKENKRTNYVLKGVRYPVKHERLVSFSPAKKLMAVVG